MSGRTLKDAGDLGMVVTDTRVLAGRYVLREVLGAGGMATVWRAGDTVLGRQVAVKVLSPQYAADPGLLARFGREARHAARLSNPRLVTVFDSGVDGGAPYIVMELVAGRTLRQVLAMSGVLPPGEAVRIAAAVCEALEAAHAAGLVHRDIKPENIMLGAGGEVKVLDFGIARAEGSAGQTATRTVLGTAAYLSPEQASGGTAGPQADLYALGCVLFEMVTGTPPFAAETPVGLAYRQVHDDPGPPSARRPGLPADLDRIIAQLLAKDPAARPPGAPDARAALLAVRPRNDTAILTVPPGRGPEPGRAVRRLLHRPRLAEAVLAAALAAALAALAAVLLAGQPAPAASPSRPAATQPTAAPPFGSHAAPATRHGTAGQDRTLPPVAAAAAAFVGDLEAGVGDGQVTPQAAQELFNHLQPLLFNGNAAQPQQTQQAQQQYAQLVHAFDQRQEHGQITGMAATALRQALNALGTAVGASTAGP